MSNEAEVNNFKVNETLSELMALFPDESEKTLTTGYDGTPVQRITADLVRKFAACESACAQCEGPDNCMVRRLVNGMSRPYLRILESPRGFSFLDVTYSRDYKCKFTEQNPALRVMFAKSGLSKIQLDKTFECYETLTRDTTKARIAAMKSILEGTDLIIAGKRGTGKTHLSVAMALYKMREQGKQALFEVVPEMLDKIRRAIFEGMNYFELIDQYKHVPLLVLDDFGKEKQTDAACDYLHQIIDARYRYELQTVITTNALTPDELVMWNPQNAHVLTPIISRMLERGQWVSISDAPDYRMKKQQF